MAGISDDTKRRILDLHRDGLSRNAIARETGVSGPTVSKYVADAGLTFDRTKTETATRSRQADLADLRTRLELDYLTDAIRLREAVWERRQYAAASGGPDGPDVVRWTMDTPTPPDQHQLMRASVLAAQQSQKISDAKVDQSTASAKSMLVHLMDGLTTAWRDLQAADQ